MASSDCGVGLAWQGRRSDLARQGEQVELQRHQLTDQQKANRKQAEVLDLQAQEIRQSLDRLQCEAGEAAQASAGPRGDPQPWQDSAASTGS
ncbi:MAG: hypothetical protein ACLQK8_01800 [Streptosporangiaceae bacterium]